MNRNLQMQKKINRGDELTLTNPIDGLYLKDFLNCDNPDGIVALGLQGTEHPIFNILPSNPTNLYSKTETFLNYIAASGTADEDPSSPTPTNRCAAGNPVEAGFFKWSCEGFTTHRRSTEVRDITDRGMRLCEQAPEYDIYGNKITDDFQWDTFRLAKVLMQDSHRWLMSGNGANAFETDGILNLIDYGYVDPVSSQAIPQMDSLVVDWAGNAMCDFTDGAPDVTINGVAVPASITANLTLIDLIKNYLTRLSQRVSMTSVSGSYNVISLLDPALLNCLLDCYVCYTVCGQENATNFRDSKEARAELENLRNQLGRFGAIQLTFDGYNVTFIPWTWGGLYDSIEETYSMVFLVPRIGNYPVWEYEWKDMDAAIRGLELDYKEWMTSDGGKFLSWSQIDHTCYQRTMEAQFRICHRAPWTSMKIEGIACETLFGRISHDPLDPRFYGLWNPEQSPVLIADELSVPFVLRS